MKNWKFLLMLGMLATVGGFVACSDDDGDDRDAFCAKSCDKTVECFPETKGVLATCKEDCKKQSTGTTCANEAKIIATVNACVAGSCSAYKECLMEVPQCVSSGTGGASGSGGAAASGGSTGAGGTLGTGGSSAAGGSSGTGGSLGTGGSPGTGGTSGASDCSVCTKADACCKALAAQSGTQEDCDLKATCDEQKTNAQGLPIILQVCSTVLSTGASANVAACM